MFLGLLDSDPLVRGMDPAPDPSIIKQKSKENHDSFLLFCDYFMTLSLKNEVNVASKTNFKKLVPAPQKVPIVYSR